jgi:hypothetical protein
VSRKVPFMDLREPGKTCSPVFGRALSISISARAKSGFCNELARGVMRRSSTDGEHIAYRYVVE